ncbi:MAG: class I SAM-dependent methyltransferase [Pseudomonadota bacterium]
MSTAQNNTADFMADTYSQACEPLNLVGASQAWFANEYHCHNQSSKKAALILGGTPWLTNLCMANHQDVHLMDMSKKMLEFTQTDSTHAESKIHHHCMNWTSISALESEFDTVCGDNSFAFIPKECWQDFIHDLSTKMSTGSVLISRFFSVPDMYTPMSRADLIRHYRPHKKINFTEMRCRMMFTGLNIDDFEIDTNNVIDQYVANISEYQLVSEDTKIESTLLNDVLKYKDTNIKLFVPRVNKITELLSPYFQLIKVTYGSYGMSDFFPLVIATRR